MLLGLAVVAGASIFFSLASTVPGGMLRIYSKNVKYNNSRITELREDILQSKADLVTLQEISKANRRLLAELTARFPYQHICETEPFSTAILSKHQFTGAPRCTRARGMAAAQVSMGDRSVWIVSVHWAWPWPVSGRSYADLMRDFLAGLEGPIILAGDFNTLPWTHRMVLTQRLTKARPAGPTSLTLHHDKLPILMPLDYALSPGGGKLETRPLFGSDHLGILADVVW